MCGRKIIKKYKWKEYKTNGYKKPIIKTEKLNPKYVKDRKDCIIGYTKGRKYYYALFDLEKALKEEKLKFFFYNDYTEVELPYCTPYFFQNYNMETIRENSKIEGYWVNKYGELQEVYNLEFILKNEPKVIAAQYAKPYDVFLSYEEYKTFETSLPTGYYRFLEFIGMTPNNQLIIRGPKTEKWEKLIQPFKTEINWMDHEFEHDGVIGEIYGGDGIKACDQCFNRSCISSSGDSICGSYLGHSVIPGGTYIINCAEREYK